MIAGIHGRWAPAVTLGVFFASGFAALLYQVIWQRMLALFSGADVFSVTIIVAAFMGGLGCGNLAGGHLADRLSRATCVLLFAVAEFAVAAFALGSRWLYYDTLYLGVGAHALPEVAIAALLFISVLWPTFFMGLSLPLLARGFTDAIEQAARVVGSLYGWNTLGAALGALVTPWFLLRRFDFETCLWIGAAINVGCAIAALMLRHGLARGVVQTEAAIAVTPSAQPPASRTPAFGVGTWLAVYALSGAIALSLEIIWFRVLGVIVKSTSFTFGTLLGVYLIGVAAGSIFGSRAAARATRDPVARFLALQTMVALYALISIAILFDSLQGDNPSLPSIARFLRSLEPFPVDFALAYLATEPFGWIQPDSIEDRRARMFLLLYLWIPLLLIGPATFLMGLSFPWLQRAVQTDARRLGRRVGWLQTANIAGSLTGSLVTGFLLLPLLGTSGSFRAIGLGAIAFPALALRSRVGSGTGLWPAIGIAALLAAAVAIPGSTSLWSVLHGSDPDDILVSEDASGVSILRPGNRPGVERVVTAGGVELSSFPFGRDTTHTLLGAVPVLLHPAPKRVAVIGLGSGDTLYAAACREDVESVLGIEIIGSQLDLLQRFDAGGGDPGLRALLSHERIDIEIGDGRTWLRRDRRPYDVIEADALRPSAAYSGNLYSREYFDLVRSRLAPGGLAVTWVPTSRVLDTLVHSFPYVLMIGLIGIGSDVPIEFDPATLRTRASDPSVVTHFEAAGVDLASLLEQWLSSGPVLRFGPGDPRGGADDLNHDLFPRDELLIPRAMTLSY